IDRAMDVQALAPGGLLDPNGHVLRRPTSCRPRLMRGMYRINEHDQSRSPAAPPGAPQGHPARPLSVRLVPLRTKIKGESSTTPDSTWPPVSTTASRLFVESRYLTSSR